MKMFLIAQEDGTVSKTETISEDDIKQCNNEYISIIDISGNQPVQFFNGDWRGINNWK
jgi:hypothetical protein